MNVQRDLAQDEVDAQRQNLQKLEYELSKIKAENHRLKRENSRSIGKNQTVMFEEPVNEKFQAPAEVLWPSQKIKTEPKQNKSNFNRSGIATYTKPQEDEDYNYQPDHGSPIPIKPSFYQDY